MSTATPQPRGLGRRLRLKLGRDFARVRQSGQRAVTGCLIANWLRLPADAPSRVGVVVGKKVGGAVVRSRAKRLLRETFRLHRHEFAESVDLVLVARPSITGRAFAEVERDFLTTMRRAGLLNAATGTPKAE